LLGLVVVVEATLRAGRRLRAWCILMHRRLGADVKFAVEVDYEKEMVACVTN